MGAHTFVSVRIHYVFGTASREHAIKPDMQPRLWSYIAGIAGNIGATVYAVGGTDDHVHVFIGIPPMMPVAKAVQTIKANSSRWIRETAPGFVWQEGYAAFSVSISHTDATIAYIQNQAEHHKKAWIWGRARGDVAQTSHARGDVVGRNVPTKSCRP